MSVRTEYINKNEAVTVRSQSCFRPTVKSIARRGVTLTSLAFLGESEKGRERKEERGRERKREERERERAREKGGREREQDRRSDSSQSQ